MSQPLTIPQTIPAASSVSEGFENARSRFTRYAVTVPSGVTGASLAWYRGLRSGGPWSPVLDEAGAAVSLTIPAFLAYTGDGAADLDFSTGPDLITRVGGSFVTDGFKSGEAVVVSGSASNDGTLTVTAVTALTLATAETLVGELNVAATVTRASQTLAVGSEVSELLEAAPYLRLVSDLLEVTQTVLSVDAA